MINWLWNQTPLQAGLLLLLANSVGFLGSVFLCWAMGRLFRHRRIFSIWEPLRAVEIGAALLAVMLNSAIGLCGWRLWKAHMIVLHHDSFWRAGMDLLVMLLTMDFAMYCLHWLVHRRWLYPLFHHFHHRHSATNPLSLFVLHPFEALAFGFLMIGFLMIYPMSASGLIIYLVLNLLWGTLGHSGVEPVPSVLREIPILRYLGSSSFHAGHHETPNYNYGFYTLIWDRLFGTLGKCPQKEQPPPPDTNLHAGKGQIR